jgi:hypothetical protein
MYPNLFKAMVRQLGYGQWPVPEVKEIFQLPTKSSIMLARSMARLVQAVSVQDWHAWKKELPVQLGARSAWRLTCLEERVPEIRFSARWSTSRIGDWQRIITVLEYLIQLGQQHIFE